MVSSVPRMIRDRVEERAREKLINCNQHSEADLDAAATVLRRSARAENARLGQMWIDMKSQEAAQ